MVMQMLEPWMSILDITLLEDIFALYPMKVLEWGSGGSTIYFKDKTRSWVAIEDNKLWYDGIKSLGGNVIFCDKYHIYTDRGAGAFDVVLVDGNYRNDCIDNALKLISSGGLIFLHDAMRDAYHTSVVRLPWYRKVGDDLIVMSDREPSRNVLKILDRYSLRSIDSYSIPWDWRHELDDVPYCGYSRASWLVPRA